MKKLVELDSLRGLMAFWVFVSHVLFLTGQVRGIFTIPAAGGMAVTVFIILSGFAIAMSVMNSKASYGDYMIRRVVRIYPIYLVALIFGLFTSHLYAELTQSLGWLDPSSVERIAERAAGESNAFWPHLFAHLTLLHGAIPDDILYGAALTFNGPLWSLSLEWQFYLVAPLMVASIVRPRRYWYLGLTFLIAALLAPTISGHYTQVSSFLPLQLWWFALGILTAANLHRVNSHKAVGAAVVAVVMLLALAVQRESAIIPIVIWASVIAVCLTWKNSLPTLLRRLLSVPALVWFGERSYGFYVLHMPILLLWGTWLQKNGFATSPSIFGPLMMLAMAPTTLLAWLSYDRMEAPLTSWAKSRFGEGKTYPIATDDMPEPRLHISSPSTTDHNALG